MGEGVKTGTHSWGMMWDKDIKPGCSQGSRWPRHRFSFLAVEGVVIRCKWDAPLLLNSSVISIFTRNRNTVLIYRGLGFLVSALTSPTCYCHTCHLSADAQSHAASHLSVFELAFPWTLGSSAPAHFSVLSYSQARATGFPSTPQGLPVNTSLLQCPALHWRALCQCSTLCSVSTEFFGWRLQGLGSWERFRART